jgi:hypothetical protein
MLDASVLSSQSYNWQIMLARRARVTLSGHRIAKAIQYGSSANVF